MPNDDYIKRSDALKAILWLSIYDTLVELDGARTIGENTWADGIYDAYKVIEEEVDEVVVDPTQRWIPVTERLPEKYGEYLVTVEGVDPPGRYVTIWIYLAWCGKWADGDDDFVVNPDEDGVVTHWMKIPEPAKEDSDGE